MHIIEQAVLLACLGQLAAAIFTCTRARRRRRAAAKAGDNGTAKPMQKVNRTASPCRAPRMRAKDRKSRKDKGTKQQQQRPPPPAAFQGGDGERTTPMGGRMSAPVNVARLMAADKPIRVTASPQPPSGTSYSTETLVEPPSALGPAQPRWLRHKAMLAALATADEDTQSGGHETTRSRTATTKTTMTASTSHTAPNTASGSR